MLGKSEIICDFFQRQKYKEAGHDTIVLAGAEYGSGSSRDWAAKGPMLQVSELEMLCLFCLFNFY